MPRLLCPVLSVIVLLGLVPIAQSGDAKKEQELLQGTWEGVELIVSGKPIPSKFKQVMTIAGDQVTYSVQKEEGGELNPYMKATIKLMPTAEAKAIDLTILGKDSSKNFTNLGIYKLEGNTLTICFGGPKERPTTLAAPEGSKRQLQTLKRLKK